MTGASPGKSNGSQGSLPIISSNTLAPRSRANSVSSSRFAPQSPSVPSPLQHLSPLPRRPNTRSGSFYSTVTASPSLQSPSTGRYFVSPIICSTSNTNVSTAPFIPNLADIYPAHNPTVEAALEAERTRIKERQKEEATMDADQLRGALKRERTHSLRLTSDLATFKSFSVKSQAEAEAHEEGIINGLLRRLECLQKEKGRIIVELEREEEMLTNTLQKKLNEVRREKALLQKQIEKEHLSNATLKQKLNSITGENTSEENDPQGVLHSASN